MKRVLIKALALCLAAFLLCGSLPYCVQADAGDLDLSFGGGGKVTTDLFGQPDHPFSMALQPDGKLIVAGVTSNNITSQDFAVVRYNTDGTLDPGFGVGGRVTTTFSVFGSQDVARAVALQPDGKIVVAGDSISDFALARYNSDGSLDTSFGSDGMLRTDFNRSDDSAAAIAIQGDGKIVAAGFSDLRRVFPPRFDFAVVRYNSDGSLDPSFGNNGKVTTDFFNLEDRANAITIQADGKILLAGPVHRASFSPFLLDFGIARYEPVGSLDLSFGMGGKVVTNFFGGYDVADDMKVQADGKIIVAGTADTLDTDNDFALSRYNSDGSLDLSFGTGGKVRADFSHLWDQIRSIDIQPDGKIVAAGVTENPNGTVDFALARFNADGNLDSGFGSEGKVSTDFSPIDGASDLVLQRDGKIVVAGAVINSGDSDFAVVRYEGDGPTFDTCLQDDGDGKILRINSTTGDYHLTNCTGLTLSGAGTLVRRGCVITLEHNAGDRRVLARIDTCSKRATASIQSLSNRVSFSITDRNTTNNTCACP